MVRRYLKPFLYLLPAAILAATGAEAREWTVVGPRALGMGGASVAVANDASASYWNPAAYGFFKSKDGGYYGDRSWSATLDAGFGMQVHEDLGEQLDNIFQIDFGQFDNGVIQASDVSDFLQIIDNLKEFDANDARALTVHMNGGLRAQVGRFGIGGYTFSEISAKGDLDLVNIAPTSLTTDVDVTQQFGTSTNFNNGSAVPANQAYFSTTDETALISQIGGMSGWTTAEAQSFVNSVEYGILQAQASGATIPSTAEILTLVTSAAEVASVADTGGSLSDNGSQLLFKGMALFEFPLTYGHPITDDFAVGANVKYMKARVYNTAVRVFDTDFSDALSEAQDDYLDSSNFGIDLGALYRFGDDLRVGLVARNVNSPSFDMKQLLPGDDDSMEESAQVRAGIAWMPLDFITLALDYDLTQNDTTVSDNYKSQNLGGGVELDLLSFLQLRAGLYQNMAESDIGPVYTAGFGLNLWVVNLDFGASLSPETTTIDGNDIPKEFTAELALSALF